VLRHAIIPARSGRIRPQSWAQRRMPQPGASVDDGQFCGPSWLSASTYDERISQNAWLSEATLRLQQIPGRTGRPGRSCRRRL